MIADPQLNPAAIELGTFLPQPPEVVWRALTDPELLARWLLRPIGFDATAGTRFRLVLPETTAGDITCEVLEVRRYEQLTFSWTYSMADPAVRWTVDWTLRSQGHGTRLLLTQTGFDIADRRQKMTRNAMERTWKRTVLPRLGQVIHR
jgi:uncharacterized protein YndB with AHSA1/START domain